MNMDMLGLTNAPRPIGYWMAYKTKELDVIKTQILANPTLRSDFTGCVTLYKDYLAQKASAANATLNVSAVHQEYPDKKRNRATAYGSGKKGSVISVEDCYYNGKEFKALSKAELDELKEMREKRTSSKKQKTNKGERKKDSVTSLTCTAESLLTAVTDLKDQVKVPGEVTEKDEETAPVDNRSNRNLTRQRLRS